MTKALRPLMVTAIIFLVAYVFAVMQFPALWSTRVVGNLLTDNAFIGITAVGMTFVIISGGIDLSVGAVIGFSGVFAAVLMNWLGVHPLLAFAIVLLTASIFGALMGCVIHYLEVPPFIVTLAGMFLARGAALRFFLTRLQDWSAAPLGALVKPHDPLEYERKLAVHRAGDTLSLFDEAL